MMYGLYGYGMNGIHGMGWGMGFAWVLGIIITIVLIWAAFGSFDRTHYSSADRDKKSALDILKERYARGEINKDEFEEKKHVLS